jgi:hypothetical protein
MTGAPHDKGHPMEDGEQRPRRAATEDDLALKIARAQMDAAVSAGDATPLALSGGWLTRYRDAWWVQSEIGWLRVTDEATTADINHVAARLAEIADDAGGGAAGYGADLPSSDEGADK